FSPSWNNRSMTNTYAQWLVLFHWVEDTFFFSYLRVASIEDFVVCQTTCIVDNNCITNNWVCASTFSFDYVLKTSCSFLRLQFVFLNVFSNFSFFRFFQTFHFSQVVFVYLFE